MRENFQFVLEFSLKIGYYIMVTCKKTKGYEKMNFKKMRDEEQVKKVEKEYFELCDEFAGM